MTKDLTEQWKNGELPDDEYYCRTTHDSSVHKHYLSDIDNENMIEVLAPVPSYGDCLINEALIKDLSKKVNKLIKENAKLKELLKECQYMILAYSINHDTFTKEKVSDVVTKIDEVLK